MANYPTGNPSISMNTIWNSGEFTPDDAVVRIIDNVTPVNKNSLRNSIAQEVSLIQNYINSTFLGRSNIPVQSGYIVNLTSNSGNILVYNSGTYNIDDSVAITPSSIILYHRPTTPFNVTQTIKPTGVYIYAYNNIGGTNNRTVDFNLNKLYMGGLDNNSFDEGTIRWNTKFIPFSGLNINRVDYDVDDCNRILDLSISGIKWSYISDNGLIANTTALNVNSSGNIISFPSGQFVIGSGVPYDNCNLTVGATDGRGDLFVRTHGGGGILLAGDNGVIDRIYSYGRILYISTEGGTNTNNIILNNTDELCTINSNVLINDRITIINSGEAYINCALTVGNTNNSGNMFVKTCGGGGILLTGDNGSVDRMQTFGTSTYIQNQGGVVDGYLNINTSPSNSGITFLVGDSTVTIPGSGAIALPANATDPMSSYALTNAIKQLLIERGWAS